MQATDSRFRPPTAEQAISSSPRTIQGFSITEAELVRRVDHVVNTALAEGNAGMLRRIATLLDTGYTCTEARVVMPFNDDVRLMDAIRWMAYEYRHVIEGAGLRATSLNNPSANAVVDACRTASNSLGIRLNLAPSVTHAKGPGSAPSVEITLDLRGVGFSAVATRLKQHIYLLAERHFMGTSESKLGKRQIVQQFMSEKLLKAAPALDSPLSQRSVAPEVLVWDMEEQRESPVPGNSKVANKSVGPDVLESLTNRVDLMRRRCNAHSTPLSVEQSREVCLQMVDAIKSGDPLDVAALGVILYESGLTMRIPKSNREALSNGLIERAAPARSPEVVKSPPPPQSPAVSVKDEAPELLTTAQLAIRIHYDERTIRDRLKPLFMVEGTHYLQPFGGRKTLYIWRAVKELMGLLQETKLDRANSAEDLH